MEDYITDFLENYGFIPKLFRGDICVAKGNKETIFYIVRQANQNTAFVAFAESHFSTYPAHINETKETFFRQVDDLIKIGQL